MSPATRQRIIEALRHDLGGAQDNLVRARARFGQFRDPADMDKQWGQSDTTPREILAGYEKWEAEAKAALAEFEAIL